MTQRRVILPVGAAHHGVLGVAGARTFARAARASSVKRRATLLMRGTLNILTRILKLDFVLRACLYLAAIGVRYLDTLAIFH